MSRLFKIWDKRMLALLLLAWGGMACCQEDYEQYVDPDSREALLARLLPYVYLSHLEDDVWSYYAESDMYMGKIRHLSGIGDTAIITTRDGHLKKKKIHFRDAEEFVMDSNLSVVVLFSDNDKVIYASYGSRKHVCGFMGCLVDTRDNYIRTYMLESYDNEDVAMFNYLLENIDPNILPLADLVKRPKGMPFLRRNSAISYLSGSIILISIAAIAAELILH